MYFLAICSLPVKFWLISCLIVGDTYITYMIFNARSYTCEGFTDTTTAPTTAAPSTTVAPIKQTSQYSSCYDITETQLGFVRFKIVVFWILFLCMTGGAMYMLAKLYSQNQILFGIRHIHK